MMKRSLIFVYILVLTMSHYSQAITKAVRGASGWGFYAEFLWAINHIIWCDHTQQVPVIYWNSKFAYYSPEGYNDSKNGWEYYFEPVSSASYEPKDTLRTDLYYEQFSVIWNYPQYVENIYLLPTEEEKRAFISITHQSMIKTHEYPAIVHHLYTHGFRNFVKNYLDTYIKIKPSIQEKITTFYQDNMAGKKTIGIHLRGKFLGNEVPNVPASVILHHANKLADKDTQFFVATDQTPLLEKAQKMLNGKVIFLDFPRAEKTTSPTPRTKLHPQEGENIVIEMMLLSQCDHLVHTISNVSTTALYFNPKLGHTVLY